MTLKTYTKAHSLVYGAVNTKSKNIKYLITKEILCY